MDSTSTLEQPRIEDTLFGEDRLVQVEADVGPDAPCFCICACSASGDKVANYNHTSVRLLIAAPVP